VIRTVLPSKAQVPSRWMISAIREFSQPGQHGGGRFTRAGRTWRTRGVCGTAQCAVVTRQLCGRAGVRWGGCTADGHSTERCGRRRRAWRCRRLDRGRGMRPAGGPGRVATRGAAPAGTARTGRVRGTGGPSPRSSPSGTNWRRARGCPPRSPTRPAPPGSGCRTR
jgi:hypothetical protein